MRVMICYSGLSVNTAEANKKCILDFLCWLHYYKKNKTKITPENYPFAKSQGQLKLFFILVTTLTSRRWLCPLSPVFLSVCSSRNLVKPVRSGSSRKLLGRNTYIYVRSMIIFSTLIIHKNKQRQWSFWLQSMKHFYLHMYKYEWRGQPFQCVSRVFFLRSTTQKGRYSTLSTATTPPSPVGWDTSAVPDTVGNRTWWLYSTGRNESNLIM